MNDPKNVTALVKSLRRALKADHHVDVPHSALRASYLKAMGENPHAFSKKQSSEPSPASRPAVPAKVSSPKAMPSGYAKLQLFVTEDDIGMSELLALDEAGEVKLPEDFEFQDAIVLSLDASVPRISEYGLPDHVQDPGKFFGYFGLRVTRELDLKVKDLGDDSGGAAAIVVLLPIAERTRLLLETMRLQDGIEEDVAGYVGEQYLLNYEQESDDVKAIWYLRYLATDEEFWFPEVSDAEVASTRPQLADEPMPEGLKHVRELTLDGFISAFRRAGQTGAFEVEGLTEGRTGILYLDKQAKGLPFSQDVWFEYNPKRNSVTYVVRVVDHKAGEALAETETELTMAKAAVLLDMSIEQQLGLDALRAKRSHEEARRDL